MIEESKRCLFSGMISAPKNVKGAGGKSKPDAGNRLVKTGSKKGLKTASKNVKQLSNIRIGISCEKIVDTPSPKIEVSKQVWYKIYFYFLKL
jgi:hypothetical protein